VLLPRDPAQFATDQVHGTVPGAHDKVGAQRAGRRVIPAGRLHSSTNTSCTTSWARIGPEDADRAVIHGGCQPVEDLSQGMVVSGPESRRQQCIHCPSRRNANSGSRPPAMPAAPRIPPRVQSHPARVIQPRHGDVSIPVGGAQAAHQRAGEAETMSVLVIAKFQSDTAKFRQSLVDRAEEYTKIVDSAPSGRRDPPSLRSVPSVVKACRQGRRRTARIARRSPLIHDHGRSRHRPRSDGGSRRPLGRCSTIFRVLLGPVDERLSELSGVTLELPR